MSEYDYPIHHVKDVWSAIEIAKELKLSGEYDLFRGQRHTFDIAPSILRDGVDRTSAKQKFANFSHWVHQTPELSSLHGNNEAILAVAQHYGIKTPLLDFSYSPKIAGFFATNDGREGDTGTIICINKSRFQKSWKDINKRCIKDRGHPLTKIVDIDVQNLWRLQAQEGVFLRCHADPTLLEMFSFFLHIHFPQESGVKVLDSEKVYPTSKSHLEVLLEQHFLIDSYPERRKQVEEIFGPPVITVNEDSIREEIQSFFIDNKIPNKHESWNTDFAKKWLQEPNEYYSDDDDFVTDFKLILPTFDTVSEMESYIFTQITKILEEDVRRSINWTIESNKGEVLYIDGEGKISDSQDEFTEYMLSEMVDVIYSGMRHLPYTNDQIAHAISRYIAMVYFGVYEVIEEPVGITTEGGKIRGRGFANKKNIQQALRDDFFSLIDPEKLNESGKLNFRDTLFCASYVKSTYDFKKFIDLFITDLIPTQAAVAIEGLVVATNPMRIDIFGES